MQKILWIRNDIRLNYNKSIHFSDATGCEQIVVFILDPKLTAQEAIPDTRLNFLFNSLKDLNNSLLGFGTKFLVLRGDPVEIFRKISQSIDIDVTASKDYSRFANSRDTKVQENISKNSKIKFIKNLVVFDNDDNILNLKHEPYKVFSQFKKVWLQKIQSNLDLLKNNRLTDSSFASVDNVDEFVKKLKDLDIEIVDVETIQSVENTEFQGGETVARAKWEEFKEKNISNYSVNRNSLDLDGTSKLSPYYKFGCLSVYEVVGDCLEILKKGPNEGIESYLSEIIWREFYKYILAYFPQVEKGSFQKKYDSIKWENDEVKFQAWCDGKTGYPIVDACMRQLNQTGWMHNRGRMIVGSFLTKDLHVNWQWGEKYFKSKLIDYDISANNGGWQWVAGVGTDAAPYFRIFNPTEQSKKFDPEGKFIRKYIPELSDVPNEFIHEPTEFNGDLNYPKPIVDHITARKRTLEIYKVD